MTLENIKNFIIDTHYFISSAELFINSIKFKKTPDEPINIIECAKNKKRFDNLIKIQLKPNSKEPATKWKDNTNRSIKQLKGNYGILTGEINNIIILDIDNKDKTDKRNNIYFNNGIDEFNKYLSMNNEPNTIKIKTPSGGYHYYFNYQGLNTNDNYLIKNYLINKSGFRTSCLDIRSNGGYIVGPSSKINNNTYEIINANRFKISDMPSNLINFLLESQILEPKIKKQINITDVKIQSNNIFKYNISDDQIIKILNELGPNYLHNYSLWLKATTALKQLNKYDIWEKWSITSPYYDNTKNNITWNHNAGAIDINYLIYELNKTKTGTDKIQNIPKYKPLVPITCDISKIKKII